MKHGQRRPFGLACCSRRTLTHRLRCRWKCPSGELVVHVMDTAMSRPRRRSPVDWCAPGLILPQDRRIRFMRALYVFRMIAAYAVFAGCSGGGSGASPSGGGGAAHTGGETGTGGGQGGSAGAPGAGGKSTGGVQAGGTSGSGGLAAGGSSGQGGSAAGGTTGSGGSTVGGQGGTSKTGGAMGSGGQAGGATGTGGVGSGGIVATGGTKSTGGTSGEDGGLGSGGSAPGGATGKDGGATGGAPGTGGGSGTSHWVGTWTASPYYDSANQPPSSLANSVLRQVTHVSLGGSQIRVQFSNLGGNGSVTINSAHVALCKATPPWTAPSIPPLTRLSPLLEQPP
jgi:hypothetical protein